LHLRAEIGTTNYYCKVALTIPEQLEHGLRICIIDDDLITSGTFAASIKAITKAQGQVIGIAALTRIIAGAR
jgi:adenine/guanine phosphoribosyltransferase-like PRPP-binding protein